MTKKLLFLTALCTTFLSFGQYSMDFESGTITPIIRGGAAAQATAMNAANPSTTGINSSATSFEIVLTDTAPAWRWIAISNPGGTYNSSNGTWYKFKFLSANETAVDIQLEPWFGGTNYITSTVSFTGLTLNTWYEVEFNFSEAVLLSDGVTLAGADPGYLSRVDFKFNATGTYDGDVFYIDDISQNTSSTLKVNSFSSKNLNAFYSREKQAVIAKDNLGENFAIYNLMGQAVIKGDITKEINVETLKSGLYILSTEKGSLKFVK